MDLGIRVPIFADTNLGTHIALDVNPTLSAADFKRELEEAHLNCFPNLGKIKINGLMVKRKLHFYHLPDSCMKHILHNFCGTRIIHVEACLVSEIRKPDYIPSDIMLSTEPRSHVPSSCANYTGTKLEIIGTMRVFCPEVENCHASRNESGEGKFGQENRLAEISENHSEAILETVSVSDIIRKYFCDDEDKNLYPEVTSRGNLDPTKDHFSIEKFNETRQFGPKTPSRKLISRSKKGPRGKISRNKFNRNEVGKRLLVASNEIGSSRSSRKSSGGLYKGKLSAYSSLIKSLVFEIPDDDE